VGAESTPHADEPLRLKVSFMRAGFEADPPGYASPRSCDVI